MQPFLAVVDPNWSADSGGGGRGAQNHYALDDVDAIAHGYRYGPLWTDVGAGLLWMWATTTALVSGDAHQLARTLGFRPCAGFVWCKVDVVDGPLDHPCRGIAYVPPERMGIGQWSRVEHEHLLLCRRGDVPVPITRSRMRSVIYAPRGAHSEKPEAAWRVIETTSRGSLGPNVVGVEYNARCLRPGWVTVGRLDGEDKPIIVRRASSAAERTAPAPLGSRLGCAPQDPGPPGGREPTALTPFSPPRSNRNRSD